MLSGVSKTAILTIRARADEHGRDDRVFEDPLAVNWWARLSWPEELDPWYADDAQANLAFRADDLDRIVRRYAATQPAVRITELGCGLSTRQDRLSDLSVEHWLDVDLPEVVDLRHSWGAGGDRHEHVGGSVLDHAWMDHLGGDPASHIFIAEGLLYYLPRPDVDTLLAELARRFAGSVLTMDVIGANDYPKLLENTTSVGSPIQWKFEGEYKNVLEDFDLQTVEGFEPDRLTKEMLARYWHRFSAGLQGSIYWARNVEEFWQRRSGTILGRLR